ncbi:hypothetical protein KVR01_002620 [Diaporthe batatas]|uniref:uncharacterized protein n=1 Tax=Diaporthe batatas TaxID=748121 RepID=UPI001D0477B7|nr:uncharacterized protein KVR01_002620 [Diaporthe batatas]KAG8166931.1 hypothetical protein KVR01_002620 [Diaporthe batatas]
MSGGAPHSLGQAQRVLACLNCQQRKVKCDRRLPCANCVRHKVECEPALAPRQRRRRFPERELLDRVRRYEEILRKNNLSFEPLHPDDDSNNYRSNNSETPATCASSSAQHASPASLVDLQKGTRSDTPAVDIWDAIRRKQRIFNGQERTHNGVSLDSDAGEEDDDDVIMANVAAERVWDRTYHDENHDEFLFGAGSSRVGVELSTLHPEPIQVVRLWQVYRDNVHPLLVVTHPPIMQTRILDAAADLTAINPELEALIFSIYCVSVLSLAPDECLRLFGSPKNQLLAGYRFACRQALLKCKVLRSEDRDCLTALFLYLVSVAYDTHPRSMSSMLAVAIHIAQRMGIHMERTYASYSALEAEMCRRLWWSLVTFDHRVCELSEYRTTTLTPIWDCRMPLNLHDFELSPEMKAAPPAHEEPTEALFVVLRYLHADFLRHSAVHVTFANPCLQMIAARPGHGNNGGDLAALERLIEDKYIALCDLANPLYFTTIWTTRGSLARTSLLGHYSRLASAEAGSHHHNHQQQQQQRQGQEDRRGQRGQQHKEQSATGKCRESMDRDEDEDEASLSYALTMLECDAKLLVSPLSRRFAWFARLNFPMLAYVHVLRYLRGRRGGGGGSDTTLIRKAWRVLSESYEAHAAEPKLADAIFFVCARLVLQAWDATRMEGPPSFTGKLRSEADPAGMEVPRIVADMRDKTAQLSTAEPASGGGGGGGTGGAADHPAVPAFMDHGWQNVMGLQGFPGSQPGGYPDMSPLSTSGIDTNHFLSMYNWRVFGSQDQ